MGSGTVIIGGGSGFIGTALKVGLHTRGYDVLVISRKPGPFSMTWGDFQKNGLPENTKAVVSLAGQNILDPTRRWTTGFKQNVYASRINTTKYLASAIEAALIKPKVFVSTSGVGYYKPCSSTEYDEESPGGDFDFLSKLCTDWESAANVSTSDVRTVKIRCGVVLGREGGMIKQLYVPFYLGFGGPVGNGEQFMPWIHIRDIVNLYIHAIENESVSGVVNGVAPQLITNKEFAASFGNALWRPYSFPLPVFMLNFLFSQERAKVMTEGQKVHPKKALQTGFKYQYGHIHAATKQLVGPSTI